MKMHELNVNPKSSRKRVGRGDASGHGKTAGRGMDGQNSRSGGKVRPGFEGGQNPLLKRIPKTRGFKRTTEKPALVHTEQLNRFESGAKITTDTLKSEGIVPERTTSVKLLKRGEVQVVLDVTVPAASTGAQQAVEDAGGTITVEA